MQDSYAGGGQQFFEQTQWSDIIAAAKTNSPEQYERLGILCQRYWQPVYHYVRCQGFNAHDAEDLTQDFLSQLARGKILKVADPLRGRFRSFLLKCCKNFLINYRNRKAALKRGGGVNIVSIQGTMEEGAEYQIPDAGVEPDILFDRQWALSLLKRVMNTLKEEYENDQKGDVFHALKDTLVGETVEKGYAAVGKDLGMTEANIKVIVHRMRQRYRELIRKEISQTVCTESEVDEELRFLIDVLR